MTYSIRSLLTGTYVCQARLASPRQPKNQINMACRQVPCLPSAAQPAPDAKPVGAANLLLGGRLLELPTAALERIARLLPLAERISLRSLCRDLRRAAGAAVHGAEVRIPYTQA